MGPYSRISPSRPAGRGRRQDLGFQCPAQDADGSPLDVQDSVTIFDQDGNPETLVSCTYDDEEDPCIYFPDDGTLENGPSTCPIAESPVTPTTAVSPDISPTTSASSSETPAATPSTPSAPSSSSNPLAIGSPGFIGVIVGGVIVLLVVGILLGRCIRRRSSQLDVGGASQSSVVDDPEKQHDELQTQSQQSSHSRLGSLFRTVLRVLRIALRLSGIPC
ncbi:hypothetical protein FB451DRAFT_1242965 [Mycena latifolia]|nr:hypothetical protein FB451DRAFT_1242965 [Mycena latifolia]